MTGLIIATVVLWLFWPSKSHWHPFGGVFRHDKRTGQVSVVVQLPGRKKKARRRKR